MTDIILRGSDLARNLLAKGANKIWCAVSDNSDEEAMSDQSYNDFRAHISKFSNEQFFCTSGMAWNFAVPIKVVAIDEDEISLQDYY